MASPGIQIPGVEKSVVVFLLQPFSAISVNHGITNLKRYSMFYTYDKRTLRFVRVNWLSLMLKVVAVVAVIFSMLGLTIHNDRKDYSESEIMIIMAKQNKFSPDKLVVMIKELNFSFPEIVYAQAILETNNFKSRIFNENNNLFGMKQAVKRITKARYTQYEHAYYTNWIESLDDYALYASTYLFPLKTENDYFEYLSQNYAADSQYVTKLKKIIASMNLKSKFN